MAFDINNLDLGALGIKSVSDLNRPEKAELGQEDFMKLMIAQFQNQDPFKPLENGEFLGQLAQFSSVAGLQELKSSFAELSSSMVSNQALQASSLLGRNVLVDSEQGFLAAGGTLNGAVQLDASVGNVRIQIKDANGAIVGTFDLGQKPAGLTHFTWDGLLADGTAAAQGVYTITAQTINGANKQEAAKVLTEGAVESVTLGAGNAGMTVSLRGVGDVAFSAVRSIG